MSGLFTRFGDARVMFFGRFLDLTTLLVGGADQLYPLVVTDLVQLKVAPLHPLLRRSAALAYTRKWWAILAMGAQSAAIDCILG